MDQLTDTFSQPYKENMLEKAPNTETGMFYICGGHECSQADTKEAWDGNENSTKHLKVHSILEIVWATILVSDL